MQTQSGRRLKEPKNARPIIYGHCKFSLDNRGGCGRRDNDGGADSDRQAGLCSLPEDNILVGGRFNRCNFNLLAFLDSTQSRAGRTVRECVLPGKTVAKFSLFLHLLYNRIWRTNHAAMKLLPTEVDILPQFHPA